MLLATSALASAALPTTMVHAVDATWNPVVDNNFNDNGNWTDAAGGASVVPDGIATFNASNTRDIQFNAVAILGGITVKSGAGDYAFTMNQLGLTFNGAGLSVQSGDNLTLNVNGGSFVNFAGSSTAGQAQINLSTGTVLFEGDSTAGSSTLNVGNPAAPGVLAHLQFSEASNAGQARITIVSGAELDFTDGSTANRATITNNAGGTVSFDNIAFAGSAQISGAGTVAFQGSSQAGSASIDSDGKIFFREQASGETANIKLNDNAALDISGLQTAGTTLGSLAGSGNVFLGGNFLAVGGNAIDAFTVFSGVIQDGGESGGKGGRLIKDGVGALTLTGINTYTGATVVNNGALVVDGSIASSSGVTVLHDGTLAGIGTVSSTIVDGGTLAPGHSFGRLTVQGDLLFTTKSGGADLSRAGFARSRVQHHRHGIGDARRRHRGGPLRARHLCDETIRHPPCRRRSQQHHLRLPGQHQPVADVQGRPEL
jgi:autotransporter-associated beta strand protein